MCCFKKIICVLLINIFFISNIYALDINSKNIILYNLNDNSIVLDIKSNERVKIASLTKIMTCLVAIESTDDLNKRVIITYDMLAGLLEANAAVVGLRIGQEVTMKDLLYATFLESGADSARGLALSISGSEDEYVSKMNDKASILGLDLHFANVVGLDDINNYGNVMDVAKLLMNALENETFKEMFTTKEYLLSDESMTVRSTMFKTASYYEIDIPFILGGKTGYTEEAGKCLASVAFDENNNIKYMLVTTGADTTTENAYHVLDARNIYQYYFDNYKYYDVLEINDKLLSINVLYSDYIIDINNNELLTLYHDNTFNKENIRIEYDGVYEVSPFIEDDKKLGVVSIYYEDTLLKTIDISSNDLDKDILNIAKKHIWSICLYIILSLIVLLLIIHILINKKCKKKKSR